MVNLDLENDYSKKLDEINRKTRELERREKLFDMKWAVLEDEIRKFTSEKEKFSSWKEREEKRIKDLEKNYSRSGFESDFDDEKEDIKTHLRAELCTSLFFSGIRKDEGSLKRRYKDLLKIYHPDNIDGDTSIVQEINREYDKLYDLICG